MSSFHSALSVTRRLPPALTLQGELGYILYLLLASLIPTPTPETEAFPFPIMHHSAVNVGQT